MPNRANELEGLVIKKAKNTGSCFAEDGTPCAFFNRKLCPSLSYNGWNCMAHNTVAVQKEKK